MVTGPMWGVLFGALRGLQDLSQRVHPRIRPEVQRAEKELSKARDVYEACARKKRSA